MFEERKTNNPFSRNGARDGGLSDKLRVARGPASRSTSGTDNDRTEAERLDPPTQAIWPLPPTDHQTGPLATGLDEPTGAPPTVVINTGQALSADQEALPQPTTASTALSAMHVEVMDSSPTGKVRGGAHLDAREVSAWFGSRKVLDRVSLSMPPGTVTALIGPSGCGKSTFLRILNRMHELVASAQLAGEVLLDGDDIYTAGRRITETRKRIGMVFQKPNPFPAMSIADNVMAGMKLTGSKVSRSDRQDLIENCLSRGGLWNEVKDRLDQPGGSLSGGQQQRLCIARSLAVRPDVLLMDEPCSALDPTSTRRIEQTISELRNDVTIVIVTHNMQQAARVSQQCAFFLAEQGTPGVIVEAGTTEHVFGSPQDPRTADYVNGRFG